MPNDWKSGKWGHLWRTRHPKKIVWFQLTLAGHVQRASKDEWAKYEPVQMPLVGCTTVARRVKTLICSKIEYPKNSLFKSDKWAPAPPGDWYIRGQVRSGAACCKHAWHFQVYISSHGTHLHVNHAFLVCTKFTHGLHPCILGAHAGPPRTWNDADNSLWHASDAKQHVSGWIHLNWILGKAKSIPEWVYLQS